MIPHVSAHRLAVAARAAYLDVPHEAMWAARLHLLDALAVGLLASRRGPVTRVTGLAGSAPGGPCTVLGSAQSTSEAVAALVNGTLIHSLEFDDTHVSSVMHGGSVMAPVALAAAEASSSTGRELLAAFTVGWEILIRIGLASPGRIQARGFQITSAAGAFGSAIVSGLLHGDDDDTIANAIGIAGSQAGGTFAFLRDGDTVKAAQPGWAAHAGIMAAQLARAGVTGPDAVFDGRFGFFSLYANDNDGAANFAHQLSDLGERWHLTDAAFKLVPCCHYIHPFVEAIAELHQQGADFDNVEGLHCWVPDGAVPVIAEPWAERQHPSKAHDARWSLPYVLGLALRDGTVTADRFDGACEADIMEFAERVTYEVWPDSGFPQRFPARVRARLAGGRVLERMINDVRGGMGRPIEAADVELKARQNLQQAGVDASRSDALVGQLLNTDDPNLALIQHSLAWR